MPGTPTRSWLWHGGQREPPARARPPSPHAGPTRETQTRECRTMQQLGEVRGAGEAAQDTGRHHGLRGPPTVWFSPWPRTMNPELMSPRQAFDVPAPRNTDYK